MDTCQIGEIVEIVSPGTERPAGLFSAHLGISLLHHLLVTETGLDRADHGDNGLWQAGTST